MATFTFSISATKIDVLSGTGTLAQLYTDAIAASAGCMTNPSGTTYQVEGNRELELSSGVTLNVETGDKLQWNLTANKYPTFGVAAGSTLNLAAGCTISGDTTTPASHLSYWYWHGTIQISGTEENPVILENYRSIYLGTYDTTPMTWTYVTLRENAYASGYFVYFYGNSTTGFDGTQVAHSFTNITVSDTRGYGIISFLYGDYSAWTIEDWTVDGIEELNFNYNHALKLKGWEIKNTADYIRLYNVGSALESAKINSSKARDFEANGHNQPMVMFEECTFDNLDSGVYNFLAYCGGHCLVKGCTFKNASSGLFALDTIIRLYGTQTYTSVTTEKSWNGGGTYLHSRKLDITVTDGTDPIENATVRIRTKLEKTVSGRDYPYEEYSFLTDENGQVKGMVEDPIYLTEKEESSANNFINWSLTEDYTEKITNGDFEGGITGWTQQPADGMITWVPANGNPKNSIQLQQGPGTSDYIHAYQTLTLTPGIQYDYAFEIVAATNPAYARFKIGSTAPIEGSYYAGDIINDNSNAVGVHTGTFTPSVDTVYFVLEDSNAANGSTNYAGLSVNATANEFDDMVHIIEVSKTGYTLDSQEIAMDQDRSIEVVLTTNPADQTTIYDATFYDCNLY